MNRVKIKNEDVKDLYEVNSLQLETLHLKPCDKKKQTCSSDKRCYGGTIIL